MEWYLNWFGKDYLDLYAHRSDQEAQEQFSFIKSSLPIGPEDRILDIACGRGRHLYQFLKHNYKVVGLDRSRFSLLAAQELLKAHSCHIPLFESDMRFIPFCDNSFDFLLSLFTSFGYFETKDEHLSLLQEWRRLLKKDGWLFMDYLNKDFIMENLVPEDIQTINGKTVRQKRFLSDNENRINKEITISSEDFVTPKVFNESVKMFSLDELQMLFADSDFKLINSFGDFSGMEFKKSAPRLIMIVKAI